MALRRRLPLAWCVMTCALGACAPATEHALQPQPVATATAEVAPGSGVAPRVDRWQALLGESPVQYSTPLPPPERGPIDGTYAKLEDSPPQYWRCYRCADYRPVGGIWRVQFDRGVMRVYYDVTGWVSIGSYTVERNRLQLFNDPICPRDIGEYTWALDEGRLSLQTLADACAWGLRGENLGRQPWLACERAGAPMHAPGCPGTTTVPRESPPTLPGGIHVQVYGGDSRFFDRPPEVIAVANATDRRPPEGITIRYAAETVGYGLQRVLWWGGDWIEAESSEPFSAIGVQVLGEAQIGWARLLFDGAEVWRGDTAMIWENRGQHGGYIEVNGFQPGNHVIRLESLDFDHRPVTVASFGFMRRGTVIDVSQ